MKIANINREIIGRIEELNESFRKNVTYNIIKSHKETGFHTLFRRYIFQKTTMWVKLIPPAILEFKVATNVT